MLEIKELRHTENIKNGITSGFCKTTWFFFCDFFQMRETESDKSKDASLVGELSEDRVS